MRIPKLPATYFWPAFILLHLLGLVQAWHTGSIYLVDSIDYLSQAENIGKHGSLYAAPWDMPIKPDYYSFRPPVYGLLIYLLKLIFASDYWILLAQSFISISTIWGVRKIISEWGYDLEKLNSFLLAILIVYPSQIIHCNFVMSDILFQALLFWSFYFTVKLWQNPSYHAAGRASLLFALAMLTKPVAFLLGISVAIILVFVFLKQKKAQYLLPFLLLPFVYHSYAQYNKQQTGYYHYSSVTPIFVLKYMAKYTNGQLFGEAYADSVQDHIMARANVAKSYEERYILMNGEGKRIIMEHPLFFAWFNVKGWIALMIDPGRFEWVHFLNMEEGTYPGLYHSIHTQGLWKGIWFFMQHAPLHLLFLLAFCLGMNVWISVLFLRYLFQAHQSTIIRICIFLFVGYIMASTGVLGLSRYRIAIAPFLWIAAMLVIIPNTKHVATDK